MKRVSLPQDRQDESGNDAEERIVALPGGGIQSASDLLEKQFVCKFGSFFARVGKKE